MNGTRSYLKLRFKLRCLAIVTVLLGANASAASMPEQMAAAHNEWRAKYGSPPLKWSPSLAQRAQSWAQRLIARGLYAPRGDGEFGENLFEISGGAASARQVVAAWASEAANYDHGTNHCRRGRCGHFTQVVWRETKELGCGIARGNGREVWVCNYNPPGNVVGEKPF